MACAEPHTFSLLTYLHGSFERLRYDSPGQPLDCEHNRGIHAGQVLTRGMLMLEMSPYMVLTCTCSLCAKVWPKRSVSPLAMARPRRRQLLRLKSKSSLRFKPLSRSSKQANSSLVDVGRTGLCSALYTKRASLCDTADVVPKCVSKCDALGEHGQHG